MAHHKKKPGPAPIPEGNRPHNGPAGDEADAKAAQGGTTGAPLNEQDPKRRLGNFEGAGEHAFQQPGGKNDANR